MRCLVGKYDLLSNPLHFTFSLRDIRSSQQFVNDNFVSSIGKLVESQSDYNIIYPNSSAVSTVDLISSVFCIFSFHCSVDMKCMVSYIQWYHEPFNGKKVCMK